VGNRRKIGRKPNKNGLACVPTEESIGSRKKIEIKNMRGEGFDRCLVPEKHSLQFSYSSFGNIK
jgi:hypothetical protein